MFVVLFAFLFVGVNAEKWMGQCPNVTLVENIDLNKFFGRWYISHLYDNIKGKKRGCTFMDLEKDNEGLYLNLTKHDEEGKVVWKDSRRLDREADATNDGQLVINIRNLDRLDRFPLYILSTDYTDYAILYSCNTVKIDGVAVTHDATFSAVIKQKGKLEGEVLQKVEKALSKYSSLTENTILTVNDFPDKNLCDVNW